MLFACIRVIRELIFLVDESKFALRFRELLTAHLNSPRLTRIRVLVNEPIRKAYVFHSRCLGTTNETWKIYSHGRGHPFVDHVSFRPRNAFKGGTCENKVQQKISEIRRRPFVRCYFTRVHAGAVGPKSAWAGTAFSVEKGDRNDGVLGRRETSR